MSPDKPSKNEAEYFARIEAERREARRVAAAEAAREAERRAHHMRCPKCGAELHHEDYRGIGVERCPDCHGLWFEAGEAEALVAQNEAQGVGGLFRAIVRGVSGASRKTGRE